MVSGSGAVELILSLVSANRGMLPAILNCDQPDPEMDIDLIVRSARPTTNSTFVNTNLTPLGQAAALVIRGFPSDSAPEPMVA
jgi:3-oxoacyl-[acyl-carrier-protein] synthase II